ncbi:MAG TPA: permease-like cell division protein FtsX [Acidimicrobiales bacterium]|jgi:cell division transport system permease protein
MALKLDYVVRETSTNMRRNVTLTLAAIVTMGVSLALFGCALLMRFGVDNLSARWEEGVEMILFLDRDITPEQKTALEQKLKDNPEIAKFHYVDQQESEAEFRRLFRRNPAMIARIDENPAILPTSYRIDPKTSSNPGIQSLTAQFADVEGVFQATSSIDAIKTVDRVSTSAQKGIFVIAIGLLVAALLLILNAIRMAMFARRREIEVMKLVGATNWFIRVPFMLEGVVQGILGAAFALVGVFFLDRFMNQIGSDETNLNMLTGMVASGSQVILVMVIVVLLGVVIGAAGSGWAVSRFLRV